MEKGTATRQTADRVSAQPSVASGHPPQFSLNPWFRLHQNMGNQAVSRLLQAGVVQAKLRASQPGDADENEADRAAGRAAGASTTAIIQRKCACGGTCSKCAGDEDERRVPRLQLSSLSSRSSRLQRAAKEGSVQPETATGKTESSGSTLGLLVEDEAPVTRRGQMKKSAFLDLLEADICATADAELAASGRSTASCPYIAKWLAFYRGQSSVHIERALLKYAPETAEATGARDYIRDVRHRVRRAVVIWAKTGRVTGVPTGVGMMPSGKGGAEGKKDEGFGTGLLRAVSGAGRAQFKEHEGATAQPTEAESVRDQLGYGRTLDPRIRLRMESAFGSDFSSVRVHDDDASWGLSSQLNARAFTVGNDVAFGAEEYKPGTLVGDALIAHELAHVVQQGAATQSNAPILKGEGDDDALEADADLSAVGAVASLWAGAKGKLADIGRNAAPQLKSGLKLQRCSFEKAPTDLQTAEAKATWIAQAMKDDKVLASQEIVKVFKTSATEKEFLDIQKRLDMAAVIDYLERWDAIQVGAIGPIIAGTDKLNELRTDYIVDAVNDYSLANAMVFVMFIFNRMYTDDMRNVLSKLAANKRIKSTIRQMDPVLAIIKERGLNIDDFKDPDESAYYFGRGVVTSVGNFLGSSELGKSAVGQRYFGEQFTLPPEYQEALQKIQDAQSREAFTLGNMAWGGFDYLAFGLPGSVYGLVRGTIGGVIDLSKGNYEEAGGELTGAMILILSYVGAKAVAKIRTSPGARPPGVGGKLLGPEGAAQGVLEQSKAVPKAVARLNTIVQLSGEGEAAATTLVNRLGENGVVEVGRYIQADSKAARFVYENGIEGAEALQKAKGNLAEAARQLPTIPKQLPPPAPVSDTPAPAATATTPPPTPQAPPVPPEKVRAPKTAPPPEKVPAKPADVPPADVKESKAPTSDPAGDKVAAAQKEADVAKKTADDAKRKADAAKQDVETPKDEADAAKKTADDAQKKAAAKADAADQQRTQTPTDKPETKPPVDPAARLNEIRAQRAQILDEMKELDEKRVAAEARARDASAQAVRAQGAKREALLESARSNRQSAQEWKDQRDGLRIRNNVLADEEARLAPRVTKPTSWQGAEDALRREFSGRKKRFILRGENRDVDCFTDDGVAREAKFGPQGLSDFIQKEINKDVELMNSRAVKSVEWHFYENVDGAIGPWGPLADALRNAGIRIVLHK